MPGCARVHPLRRRPASRLRTCEPPRAGPRAATSSCTSCRRPPRFWINNQSRMYLLEGTADLQHSYHLKMGDVLIFAQKADKDKTVVLAGRPATRADAARKAAAAARKPSPTPAGAGSGKGGPKSKDVSSACLSCRVAQALAAQALSTVLPSLRAGGLNRLCLPLICMFVPPNPPTPGAEGHQGAQPPRRHAPPRRQPRGRRAAAGRRVQGGALGQHGGRAQRRQPGGRQAPLVMCRSARA